MRQRYAILALSHFSSKYFSETCHALYIQKQNYVFIEIILNDSIN